MRYTPCRNVNKKNKVSKSTPPKIYLVASFSHAEFILISRNAFILKPMSSAVRRGLSQPSAACTTRLWLIAVVQAQTISQPGESPLVSRMLLRARGSDVLSPLLGTPATAHRETSVATKSLPGGAGGNGIHYPTSHNSGKAVAAGQFAITYFRFTVVDGPCTAHCCTVGSFSTGPSNNQAVSHLRFAFFFRAVWDADTSQGTRLHWASHAAHPRFVMLGHPRLGMLRATDLRRLRAPRSTPEATFKTYQNTRLPDCGVVGR